MIFLRKVEERKKRSYPDVAKICAEGPAEGAKEAS
jgi:hypothetical protein